MALASCFFAVFGLFADFAFPELDFDEETTGLFEKGKYTYDCIVEIEGIGRRTIIDQAPVLVE